MKGAIVSAILLIALSLGGCPKGAYHDLVVVEHDAAATVSSFQQAEKAAFAAGELSADEHALIESKLAVIAKAGAVLTHALEAKADASTVSADINVVIAAVNDLNANGLTGLKNPTAKAALTASLAAIQAVLQNIQTIVATQKVSA